MFDSMIEHRRYCELKLMQRAKEIRELEVHPRYEIVWPGDHERICFVELDFQYTDKTGLVHVEDVKGHDTALSKLKRRLVKAAYRVEVEIVK